MTEDLAEKPETIQLERIIEEDKILISDEKGIEEFYNTSSIGDIEQNDDGQKILHYQMYETSKINF